MEAFQKIGTWFQLVTSILFLLFGIIYTFRLIFGGYDLFYIVCFGLITYGSYILLRISVRELKENK